MMMVVMTVMMQTISLLSSHRDPFLLIGHWPLAWPGFKRPEGRSCQQIQQIEYLKRGL